MAPPGDSDRAHAPTPDDAYAILAGKPARGAGNDDGRDELLRDADLVVQRLARQLAAAASANEEQLQRDPQGGLDPALPARFEALAESMAKRGVQFGYKTSMHVQLAMFALARLGKRCRAEQRSEVDLMASGLAARLLAHGITPQPDLADSQVVELGAKPAERRRLGIDALSARVRQTTTLVDSVAGLPGGANAAVRAHVPTLLVVAAETRLAYKSSQVSSPEVIAETAALEDEIDVLLVTSHVNRVDLAQSGLHEILDACSEVMAAAGGPRKDWRADYYGKRTAADDGADRRKPANNQLGSKKVRNIVDWFKNGAVVTSYLLNDLEGIVTQPPPTRQPSLFERILVEAVQMALGAIPSYLGGLVGAAFANTPAAPMSPTKSPFQEYLDKVSGDEQPAEPKGDANQGLKGAAGWVAGPVTDAALANARASVSAGIATGDSLDKVFIQAMTNGAVADMHERFSQASALEEALELIPPAQLDVLWTSLGREAVPQANAQRVKMVSAWASFIANAAAQSGTLEAVSEMHGSVRIPITADIRGKTSIKPQKHEILGREITTQPTLEDVKLQRADKVLIEYGEITMNGMSESALHVLRAANQPLATAAVPRVLDVDMIDHDGTPRRIGIITISADGVVDASNADPANLAKIGAVYSAAGDENMLLLPGTAADGVRALTSLPGPPPLTTAAIAGLR